MTNALSENEGIIIDCSSAAEADLTFIQLLISARHTAEALNKTLSLIAPEEGVVMAAAGRAGISFSELPSAPDLAA